MTTRALLVDDHELFLEGLGALLEQHGDVVVVGKATDGSTALKLLQTLAPDIVIMDLSMSTMNGIEATRRIRDEFAGVKVLCLSMHSEPTFVESALEAGASAYLLKNCHIDELMDAIKTVRLNQSYVSKTLMGTVVAALKAHKESANPTGPFELLTERERQVLQLIAEGHSTRTIATKLGVSAKTVGSHREHVMAKLGFDNVAALTKYAIVHGLTTTDPYGTA